MNNLVLAVVAYLEAQDQIQQIRRQVFQVEQQVDPALDFDGQDERATHLIACLDNTPIGTTRIRYLSDRLAKIERVAVLSAYRGQGVGKALMAAAVAFLDKQQIPDIKVNAQIQVKDFYEKLGFQQRGDEFVEAGIRHVEMWRSSQPIEEKLDRKLD